VKKLRLEIALPFLWLLFSVTRGVIFWRAFPVGTADVEDYLAGSPIDRLAYLALMILALAWMMGDYGRRRALIETARKNRYLLLFYGFMLFSVLFSAFPMVSLKRFIKTSGTLVMVLLVWTSENPRKTFTDLLARYLGAVMVLSLLFIYALPDVGTNVELDGYVSWVGITTQKNSLGSLAALSSLFYIWVILNRERCVRRGVAVVLLILSLYLLLGSSSTTAQVIAFIGSFVFVAHRAFRASTGRRGAAIIVLWLAVMALGILVLRLMVDKPLPAYLVEGLGKDITLTGRTFLWAEVVRYAMLRPWFGYGFGGFWLGDLGNDLWTTFNWQPNQAHNGYLDVFVQLGAVGSTLFLGVIIQAGARVAGALRRDRRLGIFLFVLFMNCIVTNFSESSFIRLNSLYWFVFLLVACCRADRLPVGASPAAVGPRPVTGALAASER
jgi:exopolysaccharide production protein ExoQ